MEAFFGETREQSLVKTTIVSKYFWAWAKVIIPTARKSTGRVAYIDLFAGPGRYDDGTKSTPLVVLEKAIADDEMRKMLVCIFNDKDESHSRSLQAAIEGIPGINSLKHKPKVYNEEVGDQIVKMFAEMSLVPTLFFVDPWGYKGLSLRLVNSVLKDWGCDCLFFFNYNRINMGLSNPLVKEHMDSLFGEERADQLRVRLETMTPEEREFAIVEELAQALRTCGGEYVLPFRFRNARGTRTSHHLVFVSKNFKGYEIMKEIMARESSASMGGVPSFEYNPATERQPMLFALTRSLHDLAASLLGEFRGQSLSVQEVYERHSVGTPFIKRNYKQVLLALEAGGQVTAEPPADERKKGTLADRVLVSFVPRPR